LLGYDNWATLEANVGGHKVSAFQRLVRFTKTITLLSFGSTILSTGWIAGRQVTSWLQDGETYTMASSDKPETAMADWLLDVPAIVPVLIASALLLGFYLWLTSIEQASSRD
jgi:hypothetical protein